MKVECPNCKEKVDLEDCVYMEIQVGIFVPNCECGYKITTPEYACYESYYYPDFQEVIDYLSVYNAESHSQEESERK